MKEAVNNWLYLVVSERMERVETIFFLKPLHSNSTAEGVRDEVCGSEDALPQCKIKSEVNCFNMVSALAREIDNCYGLV